jgi:hypothetical protein
MEYARTTRSFDGASAFRAIVLITSYRHYRNMSLTPIQNFPLIDLRSKYEKMLRMTMTAISIFLLLIGMRQILGHFIAYGLISILISLTVILIYKKISY